MSARQSVVEQDARRYATTWLLVTRGRRSDRSAVELLDDAANSLAGLAARAVLRRDMPEARRYATAHQLVTDSRDRLAARKSREHDAANAAEAAKHGIKAGDVVRITRASHAGAAGTDVTIEDVSGNILWITVHGERRIVWASDVELVTAPRDRVRIAAAGDAMVGMLGVVESVSTHTPTGRQYADVRTDDGSRATWPADELERVDAPHAADCLCSPCEDARWRSPAVPA